MQLAEGASQYSPVSDKSYDQGQVATDGELKFDTVAAHNALREDSKRARLPREEEWNKNWNLYNNYYNFRAKAEWQSKIPLSRVNTSVRFAAKLFKKGLVGSRDFYSTKGYGQVGKLLAPHVHKIAKYHLDVGKMPARYYTALVSGMISTPVIMKVYPKMVEVEEPESVLFPNKGGPSGNLRPPQGRNAIGAILGSNGGRKKKRLRIMFDPCSAFDIYFDPYGGNMYLIHDIDMDYHDFKAMAESPEGRAMGWDPDICKVIDGGETAKYEEEVAEAARKGQTMVHSSVEYRKRVRLSEFWGTLVSEKGNLMFRNSYHVVVNEKYLGVKPRPITLPGKKWPYVWAGIIEKPFSTWHQTMVENVSGIQVMLTELVNLILDANLYSSVHAFELDIDQVYDPYEFRDGVFPGKTYKKRGNGLPNAAPMIRDVTLGQFPAQVLEVFQALNTEYQQNFGFEGTYVPSKGKKSATQAAQEAQQQTQFLSDIARDQEENFLEPMLEKVYDYVIAYQRELSDPVLIDLLGEEAATQAQIYLNRKDYREYLEYAPITFQADGMSRIAQRMKELDKVMAFINLLGNSAKAIPQILQQVNWRELLELGVYALDWDVAKVLAPGPGEDPTKLPPDIENPAKGSQGQPGQGGSPDRSPAPPGVPETAGSVPTMASMTQAFNGYKGQQVIPEMNGG
jgi:hypothetical protein